MIHCAFIRRPTIWMCLAAVALVGFSGANGGTGQKIDPDRDRDTMETRLSDLKQVLDKNHEEYSNLKEAGILAAQLARDDAKAYAAQAVEWLTRAHEIDKMDDETLCHLGSATTLMARTTRNPFKKTAYVNRGCGYMDKAVRRSPDNIAVRMTRAANSMSLPGFLNRCSFAFEDYEYLVSRFERDPSLSAGLKHTVYAQLAELYRSKGDEAKADHYRELASVQ